MIELQRVCYVRMGTRDIEGATRFATDVLGLEIGEIGKGAVYFKSDEREHTLCYLEGDPRDQAVAFEVGSRAALAAAAGELERLGHAVHAVGSERAGVDVDGRGERLEELVAAGLHPAGQGGDVHGWHDGQDIRAWTTAPTGLWDDSWWMFGRLTGGTLFHPAVRLRVEGLEHVPDRRGAGGRGP